MDVNGGRVSQDSSILHLILAPYHLSLANMKVITSIYLNCRPDLRDEWLAGNEVDDTSDAQVSGVLDTLSLLLIFAVSGPGECSSCTHQIL